MPPETSIRSLFLTGAAGRLEALLNAGSPTATHAAVVCHPHPLYGGTLHNKVVFHAMKALHSFGFPVLRFNFRGTGLSEGEHANGVGEVEDVRAADRMDDSVYDFSFLRDCPKPKLFVSGSRDQFAPSGKLEALVNTFADPKKLVRIEAGDHFFEGRLKEMRAAIEDWLSGIVAAPTAGG